MRSSSVKGDWTIGDSCEIQPLSYPTTFGATSFVMENGVDVYPTLIMVRLVTTDTFSDQDGKTKFLDEMQNRVPRFTNATITFIPKDLASYIQRKGFTDLYVLKRSESSDTKLYLK